MTSTHASTPVGVFFMDDDPIIRQLLKRTCPDEYQILGEAVNCQGARERIPGLVAFDGILVTILDGTLRDGRGEDIAQEFKEVREDTFVVSFSANPLQTWGDANFQKGPLTPNFWRDVGELVSQIEKCR